MRVRPCRPCLTRAAPGRAVLAAVCAAAMILPAAGGATAAPADPEWASAERATIRPGMVTTTEGDGGGGQACTSNFLFLDSASNAYLGQAAHCASRGEATQTDGCQTQSRPLGTPVTLGASGVKGTLEYSSWTAMQEAKETNENACGFNDFALVRIPDEAVKMANPSVSVIGGPTELRTSTLADGEAVFSYGSSPLRGGLSVLSPKQGLNLATEGGGWSHTVFTASPGVPGDSGSGFLDSEGRAFGVLSTLALAPIPGSNGVADLAMALEYAQRHSEIDGLRLAKGTEPFAGSAIPAA